MGRQVTLGGDRLGSGKKQKVSLHGFERSTHDLGFVWRNTQAPGTLVPFMNLLALPGDTFDINLGADVKTHPTLGPLFASFKLQLDVFECPIRLYHAWLHNNKLKIGLDMQSVKLPKLRVNGNPLRFGKLDEVETYDPQNEPLEWQQINQSSLLAYLGIRGIGNGELVERSFNGIPYLAYWDIYKNYYANKQEEIGAMIHTEDYASNIVSIKIKDSTDAELYSGKPGGLTFNTAIATPNWPLTIIVRTNDKVPDETNMYINYTNITEAGEQEPPIDPAYYFTTNMGVSDPIAEPGFKVFEAEWTPITLIDTIIRGIAIEKNPTLQETREQINIQTFPLENIDAMRDTILRHASTAALELNGESPAPYGLPLQKSNTANSTGQICSYFSQEGLALKTYQSDQYNNWLNTEWLDGDGGINEITAISTEGGSFDINTLNLANKVYEMLARIAVSGGTYRDWLESVYDHEPYRMAETPMYCGGLSKEIIFQEVVSTAATATGTPEETEQNPLGQLGGKGGMAKKHKGGQVVIKVAEPSIILGLVSITPRIDYYQGNDWTVNLQTMDDLHKPGLDEIGFQDLITDQMAFWDTIVGEADLREFKAAGKQPAWLNYMTNTNKVYGNFADERNEMFMTLTRRYEPNAENQTIKDLTTYIDPEKFNYAFAQTDLTAQNFWVQIGVDITARRKMSAKLMPNL